MNKNSYEYKSKKSNIRTYIVDKIENRAHLDVYAAILLEYRRIRKKNGGGSWNERRSIMLQFRIANNMEWTEGPFPPAFAWYGHLGCIDITVTHFAFLPVVACYNVFVSIACHDLFAFE